LPTPPTRASAALQMRDEINRARQQTLAAGAAAACARRRSGLRAL
jgi:hypothetical protein